MKNLRRNICLHMMKSRMYNIAIRADGGPSIGMGHVMRCLAVAEELKDLGCRVYFIGKYKQGLDKAAFAGFETFQIEAESETNNISDFDYGNIDDLAYDLAETHEIIESQRCDLILVDKYNLTSEYFIKLREFVKKIAFIDDMNLFRCSADIIINGGINASSLGYDAVFEGQRLLLGIEYILLRREFSKISAEKNVRNFDCKDKNKPYCMAAEIMITTGGADPYNCTGRLLEILLNSSKTCAFRYNVIIGSGFVHTEKINKLASDNFNIKLYADPELMSEIMLNSDIAISTGGGTLYELCCCGTPTLAFILADNQKGSAETLHQKGYIHLLGGHNEFENIDFPQIVSDLIMDYDARKNMSKKMRSLVDGKGVYRTAKEIIDCIEKPEKEEVCKS